MKTRMRLPKMIRYSFDELRRILSGQGESGIYSIIDLGRNR